MPPVTRRRDRNPCSRLPLGELPPSPLAYGFVPISGSGSLVTITVEASQSTGREPPPAAGGVTERVEIQRRVQGWVDAIGEKGRP